RHPNRGWDRGGRKSWMESQKTKSSHGVAIAGTVTKKPVRNRTFNQLRSHTGIGARRPHGPNQVKELTGKVALVTGGAVRVGRAIALGLAAAGADVAIGYRRSTPAAPATPAHVAAPDGRRVAIAPGPAPPP